MKLRSCIGLLFVALISISCAHIAPTLPEMQAPRERTALSGYSLVPPDEAGWVVLGRNSYQITLAKRGNDPDESTVIYATVTKLPDFRTPDDMVIYVKDGQINGVDLRRFVVTLHDVAPSHLFPTMCVMSHQIVVDSSAVKAMRKTENMVLESIAITCAHPKNSAVGINVSYSQRHYRENSESNFREKAARVLNSVEFIDL